MLTFDTLTVGLLAAGLFLGLIGALKAPVLRAAVAGVTLTAGLAHLVIEGPRWQMAPAYVVLVLQLCTHWGGLIPTIGARIEGVRWGPRLAARSAALFLLGLSVTASFALPMFRLPPPTGPFQVGTTTLHFTDQARYEPHTVEPFDRRELPVRVWYPAASVAPGARPVAYLRDGEVMSRAMFGTGALRFLFGHLASIPTHALGDAPISSVSTAYPVLVFSHGRTSFPGQNMTLMEDLASRGYVVFAIDHAYGAAQSVLSSGRIARFEPRVYELDSPEVHSAPAPTDADMRVLADSLDGAKTRAVVSKLMAYSPRADAINRYGLDIWVADQRFVLDEIERLQAGRGESPFAGRLDLSRLGMIGMSQGGAATIATCATDSRCKAGVSLDGFALHLIETPPQQRPFMTMNNGDFRQNLAVFGRGPSWDYWMSVQGTHHANFTDMPMVTRLWRVAGLLGDVKGGAGPIEPRRMQTILRAYVRAFFDKHLMSARAPLLDGPSSGFPEVKHFTVKQPAQPIGKTGIPS